MKKIREIIQKRGKKAAVIAGFIITVSFVFFHLMGMLFPDILGIWDARLHDQLFRLRYACFGREEVPPYFIHAAFTDAAINEENISLWNREVYARLISVLHKAGAGQIAYDIFFQNPREAVKQTKRLKAAAQLLGIDRFKLGRILKLSASKK